MLKNKLNSLEKKLNLLFKNKDLLLNVFIHRSYLNEHKNFYLSSNEKLEFLGDSVLSLITTLYLYQNYPRLTEGISSDIKSTIVCAESLYQAAVNLNLGEYLFLSKGEEKSGGRKNLNILADSFEALIAAIFLEFGFETSYKFVKKYLFQDKLDYIIKNKLYQSAKSQLQEYTQAKYKNIPQYELIESTGPEHNRVFKIKVLINKKEVAYGQGRSKKDAEENAAKNALKKIKSLL